MISHIAPGSIALTHLNTILGVQDCSNNFGVVVAARHFCLSSGALAQVLSATDDDVVAYCAKRFRSQPLEWSDAMVEETTLYCLQRIASYLAGYLQDSERPIQPSPVDLDNLALLVYELNKKDETMSALVPTRGVRNSLPKHARAVATIWTLGIIIATFTLCYQGVTLVELLQMFGYFFVVGLMMWSAYQSDSKDFMLQVAQIERNVLPPSNDV